MTLGILEYRNTGVQEYRSTGIQEYRALVGLSLSVSLSRSRLRWRWRWRWRWGWRWRWPSFHRSVAHTICVTRVLDSSLSRCCSFPLLSFASDPRVLCRASALLPSPVSSPLSSPYPFPIRIPIPLPCAWHAQAARKTCAPLRPEQCAHCANYAAQDISYTLHSLRRTNTNTNKSTRQRGNNANANLMDMVRIWLCTVELLGFFSLSFLVKCHAGGDIETYSIMYSNEEFWFTPKIFIYVHAYGHLP